MPALTLANLVLYAAQAALLIGALALVLAGLRPSPAFRLAACRAVLVVLLVLPFQGVFRPAVADAPAFPTAAAGGARAFDRVEARAAAAMPWGAVAGTVLVAGMVGRLAWFALGLVRLRRLSRGLPAADASDDIAALQDELGTRAHVHFAPHVAQPVTFGLAPARVLLPASLLEATAEQRRAVLCHELLHVRRRDWAWVLADEAILTLLWFHPAVWWLVGELQLAREQVVDRLTVAATGARRAYMDALFSAADAPSAPPLLAGFLRRRHLARRGVSLAEEVVMSRARLAVGGLMVVGVLIGSGAVGLAAWPLAVAQAPAGGRITIFQPAGSVPIASRTEIEFPSGLSQEMTSAMVLLDAVVDASGGVSSVRLVSLSARNATTGAALSAADLGKLEASLVSARNRQMEGGAQTFGDGAAVARDLEALTDAASAALRQWRFGPPQAAPAIARVPARFDLTRAQASFGLPVPLSGFPAPPTSTFASAPPPASRAPADVLRVGGNIRPPQKIVNVPPVYPQDAQDARVQGVVIIEAKVDADGSVAEAWVLRSIPMLDQAALDAVRQWRYAPTLLNGAPIPVIMTVTVNFTLSD
jgi:TonB family protein